MSTRDGAIARALGFFDSGAFRDRLSELVAIPSTLLDPAHEADTQRYLADAIQPWLARMGFTVEIHPNPLPGLGPILVAQRIEGDGPTILTYGHGDTVAGLDDQWRQGLKPWTLVEEDGRWYGRGTADNKGQHAINLCALEAVLAERGGRLGFNLKLLLETSEERGSTGLREFIAAHADALRADVLIGSDGPRVATDTPTLSLGNRGLFHFELALDLRPGGVHSGNWGGITTDPAIVLAHAISTLASRNGQILVPGWLPPQGLPAPVRAALGGLVLRAESDAATIDAGWGEPGLSAAEKVFGWTSFIVVAMTSGRPQNPMNAVAPSARAHCQLRYPADCDPAAFEPALRAHLDAAGFPEVRIENAGVGMPASRTDPSDPWVRWTLASMDRTLDRPTQIIPSGGGGLPSDMFVEHLRLPVMWFKHSYNGCKQHGPDEHLLIALAREGTAAFAGLWWDLGEGDTPSAARRA